MVLKKKILFLKKYVDWCLRLLLSAIEFSLSHLSGGEITTLLRTRDGDPRAEPIILFSI